MSGPPDKQRIYHITHVDNLPGIIAAGGLLPDSELLRRGGPRVSIGMASIKKRRLRIPVSCHPGTFVGDYVPFYLCPRSVMLYIIHKANDARLAFKGGQSRIVHLVTDLQDCVSWACEEGRLWASTTGNASATYAEFSSTVEGFERIDWEAVRTHDWFHPDIKELKQAELLVHGHFPLRQMRGIAVYSDDVRAVAESYLATLDQPPPVRVVREWYY